MGLVFWLSVAFIAYVYVGYPLILHLWAWAHLRHRRERKPDRRLRRADRLSDRRRGWPQFSVASPGAAVEPRSDLNSPAAARDRQDGVSIVIAARNEGRRLKARLDNLLSLEFPAGKRQIIVVSDGSTDNTLDVLSRYPGAVETVALPPGGKALALNAGAARARFDILVFADARQVFAPGALKALLEPFTDPAVGAVCGELVLDAEAELFENRRTAAADRRVHAGQPRRGPVERRRRERRCPVDSTVTDGVGMYWRYEKHLRRLESIVGSMVGATGAIYAVRRELWRPLPPDTILDDVLTPMRVVLGGHRVVFTERARAFDRVESDADAEARRKVRTLAGNYQILLLEPRLLLPWRNPVWLQYVSHKLARLGVPYALLTTFAASILLADRGGFYRVALAAQVAFYLLAGYGALVEFRARAHSGAARRRAGERAMREVA